VLGTTGNLNGQSKTNDIGIECGPGLSIIHAKTEMYSHSGFSMGGISGVFYQYNFNKIFSIRIASNYERKGSRLESKSDQLPPGDFIYHFDYLSLPLLFKVSLGNKIKVFANTGPCFSYLMNKSLYFKPKSGKIYKLDGETNDFKSYDLGILFGLGMSIPIRDRFLFSVEIRDNLGLMSIRDNYEQLDTSGYIEGDVGQRFKAYTNSASFIIGFAYRFSNSR
jgi:hypothetical protein